MANRNVSISLASEGHVCHVAPIVTTYGPALLRGDVHALSIFAHYVAPGRLDALVDLVAEVALGVIGNAAYFADRADLPDDFVAMVDGVTMIGPGA